MSMDIAGSKPNAKEEKTALRNDGFVHDFNERAYFFRACHAISRPSRSATKRSSQVPNETTNSSSDKPGLKPASKEVNTDLQYEGFVHSFEECAFAFSSCHAISYPLNSLTSSGPTQPDNDRCACFVYQSRATLERSSQTERDSSLDIAGFEPTFKEANTALRNDGFVHDLKGCAYVCGTCHAISRPRKSHG